MNKSWNPEVKKEQIIASTQNAEATKESPIFNRIGHIDMQQEDLQKTIILLEERLQSIISPHCQPAEESEKEQNPTKTEMENRLYNIIKQNERIKYKLDSIITRIGI